MEEMIQKGRLAKEASYFLANLSANRKNEALNKVADSLVLRQQVILEANEKDMKNGARSGLKGAILDRLMLDEKRIRVMADGLRQIALLEDPVGDIVMMKKRPNGLVVGQKRVPLGVIGIIYEARPNVGSDVFGLCLKSGNAAILRGGKDAFFSNKAIGGVINDVLRFTWFSCWHSSACGRYFT